MKVKTLGNKENPAILMIPGMFCTGDMPEKVDHFTHARKIALYNCRFLFWILFAINCIFYMQ